MAVLPADVGASFRTIAEKILVEIKAEVAEESAHATQALKQLLAETVVMLKKIFASDTKRGGVHQGHGTGLPLLQQSSCFHVAIAHVT